MPITVTADDTTGALETAAGAADAGWDTSVVPWTSQHEASTELVVVDLRSRHVSGDEAAQRVTALAGAGLCGHKIDSTLRGNWAAEIGALRASGRVVVVVPAYPSAGRVCIGGEVLEHGVPVDRTAHGRDPRSPVATARPASLLPGAVGLGDDGALASWLADAAGGDAAVCDAGDDAIVAALVGEVRRAARPDVVLVGTAGVLGELLRQLRPTTEAPTIDAALARPVVVVCGSAHPVAREQLARVVAAQVPDVHVVAAPDERRDDPGAVLAAVVAEARDLVATIGGATVVVVGGDTAEALVGDAVVRVRGSIGVGIAVGDVVLDGRAVTLVSKPGAFGDAGTVARLLGNGDVVDEEDR